MKYMEELTPEQKLAYHIKIIRRFRVIIKLVIANLFWISDVGDTQLTSNVRKNIRLLLRRKIVKSPLTIKEKAILSKLSENRTAEDKAYLCKVISGLKCFRKYPTSVKVKLAAVTYFAYYGPGRVIVKQRHLPQAMYYIVTGECKISTNYYNKLLDEWAVDDIGILHPGNMFGEVALLHGTPRMTTITTLTDVELLVIKREDFDSVLKETVMKEWAELRQTIDSFPFFDVWNHFIKTECSIVSRIRSFDPDETVLGDGVGLTNFVHFIVSGSCYILEQLNVNFIIKQGVEMYELLLGETDRPEDVQSVNYCRKYHHDAPDTASVSSKASRFSRASKYTTVSSMSPRPSTPNIKDSHRETGSWVSRKTTVSQKHKMGFPDEIESERESHEYIPSPPCGGLAAFYIPKIKFETHFIKICEFPKGACFNIGEKFVRRRIIALTPLNCLLIPKQFIDINNIGYIFDGVRFFLESHIPSTEKVFKRFVQESKFKKYRKRLVKELLDYKMVRTHNSINNIPYSIRLREGLDTEYFNTN